MKSHKIAGAERFLFEDEALLERKFLDHRDFAAKLFVLGAFLGSGLWLWDYITDPAGANQTVLLRTLFFLFLVVPWLFRKIDDRRLLTTLLVALLLASVALYTEILTHLKMGMVYGIGGYMYYMLLPPLALQPFSFRANLLFILLSAALPHLMAFAGLAPGFEHPNYAVLIWPAAMLAILVQYLYSREYRKRYELEKRLEEMSYTDTLSGLHNRRYFMEFLQKELRRYTRRGKPFSLLMIDIDRFKRINDAYGHPVGDIVIQALADVLKREVRQMDFVARIGGEEFAVILPDTEEAKAMEAAERIREAAESTEIRLPSQPPIRFSISVGIAMAELDRDISAILRASDTALYEAKDRGRNRVCFFEGGVKCSEGKAHTASV